VRQCQGDPALTRTLLNEGLPLACRMPTDLCEAAALSISGARALHPALVRGHLSERRQLSGDASAGAPADASLSSRSGACWEALLLW
jgi:hypothetical protein